MVCWKWLYYLPELIGVWGAFLYMIQNQTVVVPLPASAHRSRASLLALSKIQIQAAAESAAAATISPDTRQPLAHHWFLLYILPMIDLSKSFVLKVPKLLNFQRHNVTSGHQCSPLGREESKLYFLKYSALGMTFKVALFSEKIIPRYRQGSPVL